MAEFDPDEFLREPAPPSGFDPDAFLRQGSAPASAPVAAKPAAPPKPDPGGLVAFGRGALQGATANFSDEIQGVDAAGKTDVFGQAAGYVPIMGPILRSTYGAGKYFMGDKRAEEAYDKTVAEDRRLNKEAKEARPLTYGAGELTGAAGTMLAAPVAAPVRGAGLGARMYQAGKSGAAVGAGYGAAAGAGEAEGANRAYKGAEGLVTGGIGGLVGGGAGELLGTGAKAAWDKFGAPITSAVRGWRDPTGEGYKRAAGAVNSGADLVAAGKAKGLTGAEWLAAKNRGEPVMLVDLGGEPARAMLRSASNTSPEARAVIDNAVQDRFRTQVDRAGNFIRGMISGNANIWDKAAKLRADYDKWRTPLYEAAYKAGERPLYSETLERLAGAPAVADAMKGAVETGKNHAIKEGFGAFNPPVTIDKAGNLTFNKGPTGTPTYPDLRFWDYTYRRLRDEGQKLKQSGAGEEGNAVSGLANQLRDELDKLVPQFGAARGEAAKWFKADDVIEAGKKAVDFKGSPQELSALVAKIKNPRERELFEESYVSNLALKAENTADNADLTKRLFNSKAERQRFEAVLGPGRAKAMQGFLDRERIYDWARTAVQGNSTTVRQMIESGLAGGAAGMYYGDGDVATSLGAGVGALAGLGARGAGFKHSVSGLVTSGAQKALGYVDRKTAEKAAEFLTSGDPDTLMKGLAMVRSNPRLAEGLNAIANRLWSVQGSQAARPAATPLQLPAPVRAEEEEKPRRAEGGAVSPFTDEERAEIPWEEAALGTPVSQQMDPNSEEAWWLDRISAEQAAKRARNARYLSFNDRWGGQRTQHWAKGAGKIADYLQGRDSFDDRYAALNDKPEATVPLWSPSRKGERVAESHIPEIEPRKEGWLYEEFSPGTIPGNTIFGTGAEERYQLWPEKMVRAGFTLPHDVMTGAEPIMEMDPLTGEYHTAQRVIERAQDTSGLAGSGGIGGAATGAVPKNAVGIFGGKLAKTADLEKLRIAEVMDQYQRPPQAIWEATGWFKGADGQWRFEIPDAGSALKVAEHPVKVMDDYKAWLAKNNLPRQNPDVLLETATPEHVAPLKSFIDRLKAAQEHSFRGEEGVVNFFDHPALYKAYPDLAKLPVRSQEISRGYGGYYEGPAYGVTLNRNLGPKDARSVLLHELQHAVQDKESFPRGTNPAYETQLLRNKFETLRMEQDHFDVEMRKLRQERGPEAYTTPEYLALERAYTNVSKQLERLGGQDWLRAGQEAYRRNAGEVEARNVQTRRDFDEHGRQIVPTMTEDVSRFLQRTPERRNASASAALAETPLRVAARVGDQVFEGRPGEIHADLLERNPAIERGAKTEMDLDGMMGFVDAEGKFLTREQAAKKYAKLDKNYDLEEDPSLITHNAPVLWSDSSQPGAPLSALANQAKAPVFYSALERAVGSAPQAAMPGPQWMGYLKNRAGVKPDEIAWTGVDKWLGEQKGKVTQADLQRYLDENKVEVRDVTKRPQDPAALRKQAEEELESAYGDEWRSFPARERRAMINEHVEGLSSEFSPEGATRHSEYQLPGGENYREHLLTLPEKTTPTNPKVSKSSNPDYPYQVEFIVNGEPRSQVFKTEREANSHADYVKSADTSKEGYRSSHWSEPNVLAHVRTNERDVGGKPSLHIEEIQSDWHQAGRKQGYKGEYEKGYEIRQLPETGDWGVFEKGIITQDGPVFVHSTEKGAKDALAAQARRNEGDKIPDAPFKTSWPELALKRMIRMAAEEGKDRISWTPGEAQAARYNLSHAVDYVRYNKQTHDLIGGKGNSTPLSERVPPERLADYVGKEIAERLLAQPEKTTPQSYGVYGSNGSGWILMRTDGKDIPGLPYNRGGPYFSKREADKVLKEFLASPEGKKAKEDLKLAETSQEVELRDVGLKVGGEGMKGFYDNMLPKMVEKLGKQHGVKVKKANLKDGQFEVVRGKRNPAYQDAEVYYFDIPPAWKDQAVGQGFALFADSSKPAAAVGALAHTKALKQSPLDRTQTGWTFKDVAHPHKDMQPGDWRKVTRAAESGEGVQEVELPIKTLNATQSTVNPDYKSVVPRGDGKDAPFVIKKNGSYYVQDGHHRLVREADAGRQTAKVRLVDLDPPGTSLGQMRLLSDSSQPGAAIGALAHSGKGGQLYSAMQRAIENAPQKKMHASQWEGWLKNQPGVKKEEIEWSFPKDLEGMVTKEDLLARVKEKTPELEVVSKQPQDTKIVRKQAEEELASAYGDEWKSFSRAEREEMIDEHAEGLSSEFAPEAATKYGTYQLPGAEQSYREFVTTLPKQGPRIRTRPSAEGPLEAYDVATGRTVRRAFGDDNAMITWAEAEARKGQPSDPRDYRSSHWDETNPLAHMRTNDRQFQVALTPEEQALSARRNALLSEVEALRKQQQVVAAEISRVAAPLEKARRDAVRVAVKAREISGAEGVRRLEEYYEHPELRPLQDKLQQLRAEEDALRKEIPKEVEPRFEKSLHLEEVQSDWHQAGRKQGYVGDYAKGYEIRQLPETGDWGVFAKGEGAQDGPVFVHSTKKGAEDALAAQARRNEGSNVPNAPFKSTWADLSLKQAVLRAVAEGYDSISWTPGRQQADRYNLAQHFDGIEVHRIRDDLWNINGKHKGRNSYSLIEKAVPTEKLPDFVGKELAEKIRGQNAPVQEYSGVELSLGGEGMMKFYDKMLVDKANNLFKKWGAKVEYKDLPGALEPTVGNRQRYGGAGAVIDTAPDGSMTVRNAETGEAYGTFGPDQYEQASALAQKMHAPKLKVPVLKITPKLREEVEKHGLALFADSSKPSAALNAVEVDGERVPRPPEEKHRKTYASGGRVSAANIDPSPTDAQKESGNYKKDKLSRHGLTITVENAKGSTRSGVSSDGRRWECTLPAAYGYLNGFFGKDKDQLDVYLGPHTNSNLVFIVDQKDLDTGQFDEHKIGLGFGSAVQYKTIYEKAFSDGKGKQRIGGFHALTVHQFKDWLDHGDTTKPYKAPTLPKASHKHAAYVASSDRPTKHCSVCTMYVPPTVGGPACTAVASPIDPAGWCKYFRRA